MFWKRLLSGIVLVLAALVLMYLGNIWLLLAVGALSLLGIYELLRTLGLDKRPYAYVIYVGTLLFDSVLYMSGQTSPIWEWGVLVLVMTVLLIIYVVRYPKESIDGITGYIFAFIYVAVFMSYIYKIRCLPEGVWMVWLVLIGSWGSDTCAYVVGVLFGKHHFSELSPKKTVEGCLGGIAGAAILGFAYAFFFPEQSLFMIQPKEAFPLIMVVCAVMSQIGDLVASAMKRNHDVKDYGNIIPGHGGILDRFDSVLFVAPFVYYLLIFFATLQAVRG